jgi:putative protease
MKNVLQRVELLSPAKDLTCAIEAVKHGADAVYIGAPKFSARASAGNSIDDIRRLCDYAHTFGVRVYAALNTILKDDELGEAERLIHNLYAAGTDALIIQDMGIMQLDLPPMPLHASTQTDNRTPVKVKFLEKAGFSQVVLARELTLEQIRRIAEQTSVRLEVFVHGALCTGYSGQCYISAALNGRSANRGECAQCCRLPYTLTDAQGTEIIKNKHLLSLKDMNRSDNLEALLDAGVSSFKIEGRLKDVSYVKNITAWYSQKLDAILARRPGYRRASAGRSVLAFEPAPEKSFNRGFTSFYLEGRTSGVTAFDTPKFKGVPAGVVNEGKGKSLSISAITPLHNGDGLTFFNTKGELQGFRVNRVEGNRIFPAETTALPPGTPLFRNYDHEFEKQLSKSSAERKIAVEMEFTDTPYGFALSLTDETGAYAAVTCTRQKERSIRDQENNIIQQLSKLGNTPFKASAVRVSMSGNRFTPSSLLSEMRRKAVERLTTVRNIMHRRDIPQREKTQPRPMPFPEGELTYLGNVYNEKAAEFYHTHGVGAIDPAFESNPPEDVPLMYSKHCLRYSMGWCRTLQKQDSPYKEPFYLLYKNTRLRLQFDCKNCQMLIFPL